MSAVIRQDLAKRIVDHLKGKQIQMPHLDISSKRVALLYWICHRQAFVMY